MDWSIQEIARLASTTSRTLRHYGDVGLLPPSRIGVNGYRYYDAVALVRLQRILMLRALGLGLPGIREVLDHETDAARALGAHLAWLRGERDRLDRQIGSVEDTITTLNRKEQLMAENMFDGFDHTEHKEEVERRWGAAAWANGDAWWRGMSAAEKAEWQGRQAQLLADWRAAASASEAPGATGGLDPAGAEAQALAQRQFDWLRAIPGTPGGGPGGTGPSKEYFTGLGEMYVADERFAANYGGPAGAAFVRAALQAYADRTL
jgi:DNA-binding transcriptional MerR regulator